MTSKYMNKIYFWNLRLTYKFLARTDSPHYCAKYNPYYTGPFIMFSVITNIYNKKTKGPNLMEFFTATGQLKTLFFDN